MLFDFCFSSLIPGARSSDSLIRLLKRDQNRRKKFWSCQHKSQFLFCASMPPFTSFILPSFSPLFHLSFCHTITTTTTTTPQSPTSSERANLLWAHHTHFVYLYQVLAVETLMMMLMMMISTTALVWEWLFTVKHCCKTCSLLMIMTMLLPPEPSWALLFCLTKPNICRNFHRHHKQTETNWHKHILFVHQLFLFPPPPIFFLFCSPLFSDQQIFVSPILPFVILYQ